MEVWAAYLLIGVLATGQVSMVTQYPFPTREGCDEWIEDLFHGVEDSNSSKEVHDRLTATGFCLATGKGV